MSAATPGLRAQFGPSSELVGVNIVVHGTPAPQGSKKAVGRTRTGRVIMRESSKKVLPWREAIKAVVAAETGGTVLFPTGPVTVLVEFLMPRPKAHYRSGKLADHLRADAPRHSCVMPDVDKLLRSSLDALTESGVLGDDGQVAHVVGIKLYACPGEVPGARISVVRLPLVALVSP